MIGCARHLTRVEVDRGAGIAEIQPGTIMASLRVAANAAGLDLGPDPSTMDRGTLGG